MKSDGSIERVLITTDTIGGVWQYTMELAGGLKRFGVEPVIAAMGTPPSSGFVGTGNFTIFFFPCRLEWMRDPWEDVRRSGDWLLTLANHLDPDIIHLNGYAHAARDFKSPVLVVGHSCVYSWYQAVRGIPPESHWRAYQERVCKGLQAADGVTAPTRFMLDALTAHYGTFKRLAPVPNGRRCDDFPLGVKAAFIFSAGRIWDEAKNIAALDQVAVRLEWPVLVAGEQRHPEGSRMHVKNIRLLGFLNPDPYSIWLSHAAIYALPALYEPFGLTILEAGLAGCALVLGDIPSLRELWEDAAVFVAPRRIDQLEKALIELIRNQTLRENLAHKARQRALTLSSEKMARKYLELYAHLAGGRETREASHPI